MEEIMKQMVKGVKSKYGFEETIERLKKRIDGLGWTIIGEHDFREKVGINFTVIEICNRDFAVKAIEKPENRWISAMMPCKFSVIEMPDGVYVFGMNMGLFAKMVPGELGELLSEVAEVDEKIITSIV